MVLKPRECCSRHPLSLSKDYTHAPSHGPASSHATYGAQAQQEEAAGHHDARAPTPEEAARADRQANQSAWLLLGGRDVFRRAQHQVLVHDP